MIHGLWLTERMGLAGNAYRMPLPIQFGTVPDRDRLIRACESLVDRHPALRSAFWDGFAVPAANRPTVEIGPVRDEPFDLENGPLVRFHLDGCLLTVVAHHLVFDGESKDILVRDLAALYAGSPLPELPERPEPASAEPATVELAWTEPSTPTLPYSHHDRVAVPGESRRFSLPSTGFERLFSALVELLRAYGNPAPAISVFLGTRTEADAGRIGCFVHEVPVVVTGTPKDALREAYALRHSRILRPGLTPRASLAPVSISYRRRAASPDGLTADYNAFHGAARNALHVQVVDDGQTMEVRVDQPLGTPSSAGQLESVLIGRSITPAQGRRGRTVPIGESAPERIARQARETPDAIAVAVADHTVTYASLDTEARIVAERLRRAGVQPGQRVAVSLGRTPALLAALLGVWHAEAAYVPIDPAWPVARRERLLTESAPAALITADGIIPLKDAARDEPGIAYVVFTSGSTGQPKGVVVRHTSLSNLLGGMRELFEPTAWLAVSAYTFDMSIPELWLPLVNGGTVVLAADARDGSELIKLIQSRRVSHVHATPSLWRILLDAGFHEPDVVAIAGADVLPQPLADEIRQHSAELWNLYGPTETTVWSTGGRVDGEVHIGRPLANTVVELRDARGELVPDGIPGEIWIGGAGLARGYLHREPFGEFYRTGDRARWRGDVLEFLGRNDNQVKLRGYRVELGEVEAALRTVSQADAAAAVHDDTLIGYVTAPCVQAEVAKLLPGYMVPSVIVELDRLPLTPNGKLDRAALPAVSVTDAVTPQYEGLAAQVYEIWREVLKRDDIGPDDDLFDLGGHSLTVTQIASRLRKRLGIDLPLHYFFDSPTIAGIVAAAS